MVDVATQAEEKAGEKVEEERGRKRKVSEEHLGGEVKKVKEEETALKEQESVDIEMDDVLKTA